MLFSLSAMFCGVFGHKTIKKYVPVDEMFPAPPKTYETFICYGPICRYARDIPLALKAMGGSLTDELNLDQEVDFRKIKIYYMEHDGGNPLSSFVDQRILNSMQKVIKYFKEQYGMEAERININKFKYSLGKHINLIHNYDYNHLISLIFDTLNHHFQPISVPFV